MAPQTISFNDPLFRTYIAYTTILCLKVLLMSFLTGRQRMSKKVFANPEDAKAKPGGKVTLSDPDVERVRRAHLNDLENIPLFMFLSFFYLHTAPSLFVATWLMRAFTIARILHTFVYLAVIPQPARAMAFGVGYLISFYMGFQILMNFVSAL